MVSLKRKIKSQDEETQKLILKHAAECARTNTKTNQAIFNLQKEKDSEIKQTRRRNILEIARLMNRLDYNEQHYQRQLALLDQKNKDLEKENVNYKQIIQGFQENQAGYVAKLAKIMDMFREASKDLVAVGDQRENLLTQVTELNIGLVAASKDNIALPDERVQLLVRIKQLEVELETATEAKATLESAFNDTVMELKGRAEPSYDNFFNKLLNFDETGLLSEEFTDIIAECVDNTLEPFKPFAQLIKSNTLGSWQRGPESIGGVKKTTTNPKQQRLNVEQPLRSAVLTCNQLFSPSKKTTEFSRPVLNPFVKTSTITGFSTSH